MTWDQAAFDEHNRGIFQARAIYATQPISSPSYRCRRRKCGGYGYERGGLCCDCERVDKEREAARGKRYRNRKKLGAACPECQRPLSVEQVEEGSTACSRSCAAKLRYPPEPERFLARISFGHEDECWPWRGPVNRFGYGRFAVETRGKRVRHLAHRYMLELEGFDLTGRVVMHACDNPPCVNPAHLRVGTQLENIRDAKRKGRLNTSGLDLGNGGVTRVANRALRAQRSKAKRGDVA